MDNLYGVYEKPHNYEQYLLVQDLIKHSFIPIGECTIERSLENNLINILNPQCYYERLNGEDANPRGAAIRARDMRVDDIEIANELERRAMILDYNECMKMGEDKFDEAFFLGLIIYNAEKDKGKEPLFVKAMVESIKYRFNKKDLFGAGLRLAEINRILEDNKDIFVNAYEKIESKNQGSEENEILKILRNTNSKELIKETMGSDDSKCTNLLGIPDNTINTIKLYLYRKCLSKYEQGSFIDAFILSRILKDIIVDNNDPINSLYDLLQQEIGGKEVFEVIESSEYHDDYLEFGKAQDNILGLATYLDEMF